MNKDKNMFFAENSVHFYAAFTLDMHKMYGVMYYNHSLFLHNLILKMQINRTEILRHT